MGDLKTRSNVLTQQAHQHHEHKVQKNMALLGQSVKIAGDVVPKIPGTRTMTRTATNALSGLVKLSATAMKSDEGKMQTGSSGAPAPIGKLYPTSTAAWRRGDGFARSFLADSMYAFV